MLVGPCGTTAASLYDFENRVDADEPVRKNRCAALLGISRQFIGINASAAIDRIAILVNRGIKDYWRSDTGAIGGGRRQTTVIGILKNDPRDIGRTSANHRKQSGP